MPLVLEHREYQRAQILERMTDPARTVIFRVIWENDQGNIRTNGRLTVPVRATLA